MVTQMVQNSVFFNIYVQSYLIYVHSHRICIQSHLIYFQSSYLYSVTLFIFSHHIYFQTPYLCSVSFYLYSVTSCIYIQSHLICIQSNLVCIHSYRIYIQPTFFRSSYQRKRLQYRCFPVNVANFLATSILKNTCGQLLLFSVFISLTYRAGVHRFGHSHKKREIHEIIIYDLWFMRLWFMIYNLWDWIRLFKDSARCRYFRIMWTSSLLHFSFTSLFGKATLKILIVSFLEILQPGTAQFSPGIS